ncbi:acyltransferase family protein [Rhodoblastus sp.]|uniref:acyltransferase family protein n=1 Tax=Rhodoblastus sp. TaxID=1962975 RepID=UPI003F945DAE
MEKPVSGWDAGASAPKPRAHHEFRPDINGLRALAVLSVLAFHAGLPAPGGFAGVDIFFVISGFLISRIILSERAAGDFSLFDFYGKRVKRILPALLLTLTASWIAGWFLFNPMEFRRLGGHIEASSYFSVNLWLYRQSGSAAAYFDWKSRLLPLLHLWSLSIEEQFYLVWPALLLALFKLRRLLTPATLLIFLASLAYCIVLTDINSTAAFYLLSTRAWELALGALLAQREVFSEPAPPSPLAANLLAGLGIFLMLFSIFWLLNELSPWPGYLALAPTLGCALVISAPGARISQILLGNRLAQFFGAISYPLYLWHWPLLSFAHGRYGNQLPPAVTASLLGISVLLAYLTWRFAERPIAEAYRRRPAAVAATLLAGLALAGVVGNVTRQTDGLPQRYPQAVRDVYSFYVRDMARMTSDMDCVDASVKRRDSLETARARAKSFFAERNCAKPAHLEKPTIAVIGDSHALHLIFGLKDIYRDRANILLFSAVGCQPLMAKVERSEPDPEAARCQAINEEVARNIVALQPAAIVVGGYFDHFYDEDSYFPQLMKDFDLNIAALRAAGVRSPIFIMGQVPTWSPDMTDLVVAELLAGRVPSEFSHDSLQRKSFNTEARLAAHAWGENVHYISQFGKLCGDQGCRRFVGPRVPDDMIALDYGHYTSAGSLNAAKNILAPFLDPIINGASPQKPQ